MTVFGHIFSSFVPRITPYDALTSRIWNKISISVWKEIFFINTTDKYWYTPTFISHYSEGIKRRLLVEETDTLKNRSFMIKVSVQFSCSVMSDSLWPHGLQHARLPCPSPTPRACSNSCPLSQWCHPTISSFAVPFSSHLQSFPASGSFPMSQFFASRDQSIGVLEYWLQLKVAFLF